MIETWEVTIKELTHAVHITTENLDLRFAEAKIVYGRALGQA